MDFDIIICFETHVELKTETKLFCDCMVSYDAPPNTHICPVCTGQPGALPVLNKQAVEYSILAGLALDCRINRISHFARKNYFYPDLPKAYQISQYELPFCEDGQLEIIGDDGLPYSVGIKRIHLEEDAGKLIHIAGSLKSPGYSLVDYNRSSIPLLEIVGDHERNPLRSLSEARTYLEKMRQLLKYIGISNCLQEKGQFRCDVNISLRPKGAKDFSNRSEIKNMSSFKFMIEALEFEIKRQSGILSEGGHLPQETRLFDEEKSVTRSMRSKEDASDYRYFPDPDLMEVEIDQDMIHRIQQQLPELPDQRLKRIIQEFKVSKNDAVKLTRDKSISDFFESCAVHCKNKKKLITWILKDLFQLLNEKNIAIEKVSISANNFAQLINLISQGEITDRIGRIVLQEMFETGADPSKIIKEKDLKAIDNTDLLSAIVDEVIAENPNAIIQIREGEKKPIDFLIGQIMKKTRGKAHPQKARELICQKI